MGARAGATGGKPEFDWQRGVRHLKRRDEKLAAVIKRVGRRQLELQRVRTPFHALIKSIVHQQLSGKAAATIHSRLIDLFPTKNQVTPARLLALSEAEIRGAGISRQKVRALLDLASRAQAGQVPGFRALRELDDEEIIECLTQIRGVGRWTAEMLLIFQLGRPDVLPVDDLGVRKGFSIAHGLAEMPSSSDLRELARAWKPYRSVGSWYCWRALEQ